MIRLSIRQIYLVAVASATLVAAVTASLWLRSQDRAPEDRVRHATLFYSRKDASSIDLAKWVGLQGVTAVAVESPDAASKLEAKIGRREAIVPMLVEDDRYPVQVWSGAGAIVDRMRAADEAHLARRKGRNAIVVLAAAVVGAALMGEAVAGFGAVFPILGILALSGLVAACRSCHSGSLPIDSALPLIGSLYLLASCLALAWSGRTRRPVLIAVSAVSGLIPAAQMAILAMTPKLCWACLVFGIGAAFTGFSLLHALSSTAMPPALGPKWLSRSMALMAMLMVAKNGMSTFGVLPAPISLGDRLPVLSGHRVSEFVTGADFDPLGRAVLVSAPGCHACADAKAALRRGRIPVLEIQPCALGGGRPCFSLGDRPFPVPLLIVVDRTSTIIYQRFGWTRTSSEDAILADLKAALERSAQR